MGRGGSHFSHFFFRTADTLVELAPVAGFQSARGRQAPRQETSVVRPDVKELELRELGPSQWYESLAQSAAEKKGGGHQDLLPT
jgi:hypothetical protein